MIPVLHRTMGKIILDFSPFLLENSFEISRHFKDVTFASSEVPGTSKGSQHVAWPSLGFCGFQVDKMLDFQWDSEVTNMINNCNCKSFQDIWRFTGKDHSEQVTVDLSDHANFIFHDSPCWRLIFYHFISHDIKSLAAAF